MKLPFWKTTSWKEERFPRNLLQLRKVGAAAGNNTLLYAELVWRSVSPCSPSSWQEGACKLGSELQSRVERRKKQKERLYCYLLLTSCLKWYHHLLPIYTSVNPPSPRLPAPLQYLSSSPALKDMCYPHRHPGPGITTLHLDKCCTAFS